MTFLAAVRAEFAKVLTVRMWWVLLIVLVFALVALAAPSSRRP